MKDFFKKHRSLFSTAAVLLILALGAYLRLYHISGYMTFLGDEGRDALVVKRMIVDHKFTLLGPTASVGGFFLGPIYYYFMLPFLWLWRLDPTGPAVMVALFGIATIYLVYRVGRDFFDEWVGLVAASLYALSPLVIAYSRSSWNPNLVPFFSTLFIYILWRIIIKKKLHELFWIGVILGIGLQLHYLFAFLFVVVLILFLIFGRSFRNVAYYALGVVGFIFGYGPFLAFEIRHGFPNTVSIVRFIFAGKETGFVYGNFLNSIGNIAFRLFGRLVFRLPQPELWGSFPSWQQQMWNIGIIGAIVITLCILFSYTVGTSSTNESRKKTSMLLLLWIAVTLVLFGFYRKAIYDYYFGIFFAFPFLCVGVILWRLSRIGFGKFIAVGAWIGLLYFNWQGRPFLFPPNNQLAQAKRIASTALEKTEGKPFNFALITVNNSDHVYRYFFETLGNPPVTIENEANDSERRTVTDQLIVICETYECKPLGHPLWEIAGFGPAEIVGEWDVPFVKIFKLVHVSNSTK